ncbi:MAG: hypothetical protein SGJ00_07170 [bacterium]|nr:hypothetical protein [bacterium]
MRIALLVGISGKLGKSLLDALINSKHYKKTVVLTRHDNRRLKNIHLKKIKIDFGNLGQYQNEFNEVDDVFCILGTDYINTKNLEDASLFDYEYPLGIAKVAHAAGVKNFFLINSPNSNIDSSSQKFKIRAKLKNDIEALNFQNFCTFNVNRVGNPVNFNSSLYAARKGIGSLVNTISLGVLNKVKSTPANILAAKMIEVAVSNPLETKDFYPGDIN